MSASAIYEGWVAHRRFGDVPHSFRYRMFMPLFDLEELPGLLDRVPLWSARRPAPARFRDADYLPDGDGPLIERARDVVHARLGRRPHGSVQLLANPRYAGVSFNPLSLFFLHGGDGSLDSVIAEVTNTPWGERVAYVLDARGRGAGEPVKGTFEKRMHVSPFQPMDQTYEISVTAPGDGLAVSIQNLEQGRRVFAASMSLRRTALSPRRLVRLVLAHPPMTIATLARIYANAVRLKLRGARVHPHTEVRADEQAVRAPEPPGHRHANRMADRPRDRDHGEPRGRRRRRPPRGGDTEGNERSFGTYEPGNPGGAGGDGSGMGRGGLEPPTDGL